MSNPKLMQRRNITSSWRTKILQHGVEKYSPLWGALLGAIIFFSIYGFKILEPTSIDWIMHGDPGQHFLGWHFFRSEPWNFPPGRISSFAYPHGTSLVYTDSIPLLAIPLKFFSPLLPSLFQYHGLWLFLCYGLQGFFAALLAKKITDNSFIQLSIVGFFLLPPIIVYRSSIHEALCAHWLISASLYLYFQRDNISNRIIWIFLLATAAMVHFYLLFMSFILFLGYLLRLILVNFKRKNLVDVFQFFVAASVTIIFILWLVGYFTISISDSNAGGWGEFSMNLVSPINPAPFNSFRFFKSFPLAFDRQHEGFNYLGMGLIMLILISIYEVFRNKKNFIKSFRRPSIFILVIIGFLLFISSLSATVTLGDLVFNIPMPDLVQNLFSITRASGRLFWPVTYLLIMGSVALLSKFNKPVKAVVIIVLCLYLQIIDFYPVYSNINLYRGESPLIREQYRIQNPLESNLWSNIMDEINHIVFIPARMNKEEDDYIPFSLLAANYGKTINTGYLARYPYAARKDYEDKLVQDVKNGNFEIDNDTLYIIRDDKLLNDLVLPSSASLLTLDGYKIITPFTNVD